MLAEFKPKLFAPHQTGQRAMIRQIMLEQMRPLRIQDIHMYLLLKGWEFTSVDPHDSIKTSLKRAPDMYTVGHNKWVLCGVEYSQEVIRESRQVWGRNFPENAYEPTVLS